MLLKEFIKQNRKKNIAILDFDKRGLLTCDIYEPSQFKNLSSLLLNSEIIEQKEEYDCIELWVRKVIN